MTNEQVAQVLRDLIDHFDHASETGTPEKDIIWNLINGHMGRLSRVLDGEVDKQVFLDGWAEEMKELTESKECHEEWKEMMRKKYGKPKNR